jgi:hypothetical protein
VAADDGEEDAVSSRFAMLPAAVLALVFLGGTGTANAASGDEKSGFGLHLGLLRLDASSIYDSNIDHEVVPREDYGMEVGGEIRLQSQRRNPLIRLDYRGGVERYANSHRWDRVKHRARATLGGEPADGLDLETYGELNTRTASEDRELVNQYTVSPGISLSGGGSRRVRVNGAFRWKQYVDDPGRDESIWYAGTEARTGLWRGGSVEARYRYETADSEDPQQSYIRHRIEGRLDQELGGRNRIRLGLERRIRRYSGDLVDLNGYEVLREDRRWTPFLRFTHYLGAGQQIVLDYEYQNRESNDPDKEFQAQRVSLALRWPLLR